MSSIIDNLKYKILKVDPSAHSLTIPENFKFSDDKYTVSGETAIKVELNADNDILNIIIELHMKCDNKLRQNDSIDLFYLKSISKYKVENLKKFIADNSDDDIDDEVIVHFITLSLNHTRGMQSVLLKGTEIARFLMPNLGLDNRIIDDEIETLL